MSLHRHARKIAVKLLAVLVVGAMVVAVLVTRSESLPYVALKDGKVVKLVGVTAGLDHELPRSRLREILHGIAPEVVKKMIGPNFSSSFGFGANDGLALWMMAYDPDQGTYSGMGYKVVLMDEHGCEFSSSGMGGTSDGVFSASVVSFPIYPRRQRRFVCRILNQAGVYTEPEVLGEMIIENPRGGSCADFIPEPVPITKTNGPILARLDSFDPKEGAKVTLLGEGASVWHLRKGEYEDETGNRGSKIFCSQEEVWKYRATYFRTERANFESHEVWTLPVTSLPVPGWLVPSGEENVVNEFSVKVLYWAGAGTYTLSNDVCVAAAPWGSGSQSNFGAMTEFPHGGLPVRTVKFGYEKPFVIVAHPNLGGDAEFMLRIWRGDKVVAVSRGAGGLDEKWFYELNPTGPGRDWATSHELKMEIVVHSGRTVEFVAGRPQGNAR
jgi:hypothetical protein